MLCFDKHRVRTWKTLKKRGTASRYPGLLSVTLSCVFVSEAVAPPAAYRAMLTKDREGGRLRRWGVKAAVLLTQFSSNSTKSLTSHDFHLM